MTETGRPATPQAGEGSRVAIVSGGTGAIGRAIARLLAATPGFEVVVACRNADKGRRVVREIIDATGNSKVRPEIVDVCRQASVEAFAERWTGPLHVLVNNAGVTPRRRQETPEGIELQFATNVLGYFWMIQAFAAHLQRSAPARVVNVVSYWAGDLDLTDLEFKQREYSNGEAYRQSKQADRMLTAAFAERLKSQGVSVNACHPGDVNSPLSNNLGFGGHDSPEEGARTPVWLAADEIGQRETGKYFERMREVPDPLAADREAIEALYAACLRY
jgi:NAD(P)-dependent dehydrogenase (short-subunit alcohol dehydrogenase family)